MSRPSCQWKGCSRISLDLTSLFNKKRVPRFEDLYLCSEKCLRAYTDNMLSDRWHRIEQDKGRRILRPRLGTILLQITSLTQAQLEEALILQKCHQEGRLGEWLVRLGFMEEKQITQAVAKQFGLPIIDLRHSDTRDDVVRLIPGEIARHSRCLPIRLDGQQLTLRLAIADPAHFTAQESIRRMLKKNLLLYLGSQSVMDELLDRSYQKAEPNSFSNATYQSLEDLGGIVHPLIGIAMTEKAENIYFDLMASMFWVRLDFEQESHHFVYRHNLSLTQDLPAPAGRSAIAHPEERRA